MRTIGISFNCFAVFNAALKKNPKSHGEFRLRKKPLKTLESIKNGEKILYKEEKS